jgi:hypothetical protein
LQHLLFYIKPTHPREKINDDLKINPSQPLSVFGGLLNTAKSIGMYLTPKSKINEYYSSKFKELGLTPYMSEHYSKKIKEFYSDRQKYVADDNEVMSRLEIVREMLHKPYGGKVTAKEIGMLNNRYSSSGGKYNALTDMMAKSGVEKAEPNVDPNVFWMTLCLLYSSENMSVVLNKQSKYAANKKILPKSPLGAYTNQSTDSIAS